MVACAETSGEILENLQLVSDLWRGRDSPPSPDDPALEIGHRALFLGPLRCRQDHVGEIGGFGEEKVSDDQKGQRPQLGLDVRGVRCGDDDVRSEDQQCFDAFFGSEAVQKFICRRPGHWQRRFRNAPHVGDVVSGCRVIYLAVTRKLVGFLPVFATTLSVALTGQTAVTTVRFSDQSECQSQIDEG